VYDLVISGGRVIDPASGMDGLFSVGITGGKIRALSDGILKGKQVIDASGRVVSPGFIDVHTHVDGNVYSGKCMARMGVTTQIGGNCGCSFIPEVGPEGQDLAAFFDRIDAQGFPINHAFLAPTQVFRQAVGLDTREESDGERIAKMTDMARRVVDDGAIGVSFGIEYQPGTTDEELAALFQVAAEYGVPATVHPRYSGRGVPLIQPSAAVGYEEIIEAAGTSGATVEISHLGSQIAWRSEPVEDLTESALKVIEEGRAQGLDITGDCYPYTAWCTPARSPSLDYFLKGKAFLWVMKKRYFLEIGMLEAGSGPYVGERLTVELLEKIRNDDPDTWIIGHTMREDLVEYIYRQPYVMIASDGVFNDDTGVPSHPRGRGTFTRALRWLARERRMLTLTETLEKMTVMPAERFGLSRKGRIEPGVDADITIFNPETVTDGATYLAPDEDSQGISHVIVGGVPVVADGVLLDVMPGRSVRRG
jgi:N-acyl-D-amino-acid deacylase